jgi:molybdopterin converting factor small subunit
MKEDSTPIQSLSSGGTSDFSEKKGSATLRIMGNLAKLPDGRKLEEESIPTPVKLGKLLQDLRSSYGIDLHRDSTLVLINGVEANALSDLDTVIASGDSVVFVPMFHGGK